MSIDFKKLKEQGYMRYLMDNQLPLDFLIEHADEFDSFIWNTISSQQLLTEDFIERFRHLLCWRRMSKHQDLSKDFIVKNIEYIHLDELGAHNEVPLDFLKDNLYKFKFFYILASRKWDINDSAFLLIYFKGNNFFAGSSLSTYEKVVKIKENFESKTKYGSQTELPFIYPNYRTNLDLRDLYLERIDHNMGLLLDFSEKWKL